MQNYRLSDEQLKAISVEQLAMRILEVLQRNHKIADEPFGVSYYAYDLNGIKSFELRDEQARYNPEYEQKFAEAKQSLYSSRLIVRDYTQSSDNFAKPTQLGLQADTSAPILELTDTTHFISDIESRTGILDPVVKAYLAESYGAAQHGLWLSSVSMLGTASERLLILLARQTEALLADPGESAKFQKLWKIKEQKDWAVSHFGLLRKNYPVNKDAFVDVEDKIITLFTLYRYERNDAGHSHDSPYKPDIEQSKQMLLGFWRFVYAVHQILAIKPHV